MKMRLWVVALAALVAADSCDESPPPRHIAIIPDGNRRWARSRNITIARGHAAGIAALGPVATAAWELGVEVVTFWWGSSANLLKRDPDEVANIIAVLISWLQGEGVALLQEYNVELHVNGRWRELASALIPAVESAQQSLALIQCGREMLVICITMTVLYW